MILDMTMPLSDGLKLLGSFPSVSITDFFGYDATKERYLPPCTGCKVEKVTLVTHVGTHADAPAHFVRGGDTMDTVDLEKYMGEAVLLDLSDRPQEQPVDGRLLNAALKRAGIENGTNKILLLRLTKKLWNEPGFTEVKGLTEEAAQIVVDYGFKCVGIDTMCVDCLEDMRRPVHMRLLSKGIVVVEGLVNMDQIPGRDCWFCALPLKLLGSGGSPVRAICKV